MAKQGQNVWYDLMTSDVEGARRFYGEVTGWRTQAWKDADPAMPYTMWTVGERPIGGVMPLPPGVAAPPHWIAYTHVDDADGAARKTAELGGAVLKEPFDIPTVGRVAVLADPQGAAFAVVTLTGEMPLSQPVIGDFSWAELNTTDSQAAWSFYSALFGWQHRTSMDMGPELGTYFMFQEAGGITKGGMSNAARMMNAPAHWLHYVTVDDVNAAVERIRSQGGAVVNGPMAIPGGDLIAQCRDPQGAYFAIYAHGKGQG